MALAGYGGQYKPLTPTALESIYDGGLRLLEEVGIQVNNQRAIAIFSEAGANVDWQGRVVRIPRRLVEGAINSAPSSVTLCGRQAGHDLTLEKNRVHLGTGGTAVNVLDLEGKRRPSSLDDVRRLGRLVDAMENVHFYMLPVYPHDLAAEDVDVNRFYAGLSSTTKHITGGVYSVKGVRETIRAAEILSGGAETLRKKPIISFVVLAITPLKIDDLYGEMLLEIASNRIPVIVPTEPQCGSTAPMTLAGNLVLYCAETLAQVTLVQLCSPGSPVICGYVGTVTDPRTMGYLAGAAEMGLLNAAAAQLAQFWGLPFYGTAGMSDAKIPDAQCGYESALTTLLVAMAGANYLHDSAGLLDFALTMSYEKVVIDNEVNGMVTRVLSGINADAEHLALDVIREVGPGGNFLAQVHTVKHLRKELYMPRLSDRRSYEEWIESGSKDTRTRANEKARAILGEPAKRVVPENIEEELARALPNLRLPRHE
ncbi:MAG: trimethylamine methyltransferase [Firmicutes bacterium]|nr:trimethylamine methyltransferase [Bacillota bacterium]